MKTGTKREEAADRAKGMFGKLMDLRRPASMSNNEWTRRAGVSTSFFTNLKNGSEPSVGTLRDVLRVVDVTLPEFFIEEAAGRMVRLPTQRELHDALQEALPELPRAPARRAEYLAEVVSQLLALPARQEASPASERDELASLSKDEQVRAATRRA